MSQYTLVTKLSDLQTSGCINAQAGGHSLALYLYGDQVYAVDNRCPHMGFPLDRGTVKDGILTCYWHYARFDLATGGTFDQWADDVRAFPVELRGEEVWVDIAPQHDPRAHQRQRLRDGLERNISLVIAKAAITLLDKGEAPILPFRTGLDFGTRFREGGWGQGLTMHTCFTNMLPYLAADDKPRALYHGLAAVANDTAGMPPRFVVQPLPGNAIDIPTLKRWFRRFVEVRDAEGAERCIITAVRAGATDKQLADMLFAAATDHRYIQIGHTLDFTNKALEALDRSGWDDQEVVERTLTSLASGYANASRAEESNAWRNPYDLIEILENTFKSLGQVSETHQQSISMEALVPILLGDNPQTIADGLLNALREGCPPDELAGVVTYAAALRIARFHTSNEFGDWDTALHTFTFANAVHQGLRRTPSAELVRGIFDAAMSVYLDRFLNVPAAKLPEKNGAESNPDSILKDLPTLFDRQQQVDVAGEKVAQYLFGGGDPSRLMAVMGKLLLREDRDFHTIQCVEAAFHQFILAEAAPAGITREYFLVAAARYLAAHAPTMRAQGQTYQIAHRLSRGEKLFE
jgi:nitrite reductase/ring-hydroxylating ferredoxin subunit